MASARIDGRDNTMSERFVAQAHLQHDGTIGFVSVERYYATREEADAVAATFPKSLRVRANGITGHEYGDSDLHCPAFATRRPSALAGLVTCEWAFVELSVQFYPNDVNKGKNEAGRARLRRFLARVDWVYREPYCSNKATAEQFATFVR